MNRAYIGKLMELAETDRNILHLLADSGTGFDEMFRRSFPEQIFNFGIGEENMVAAAAGMASVGKIPFVFTAGAFLAYRSMEFIRDDVCFQNMNVKIVGMGSGLSWSSLGPTHHTTEDLAVLRAIPNLMILSPATPNQVAACVEKAYRHQGPVYIKIGMNNEKEFYPEGTTLPENGWDVLREGKDCAIFTTGSILEEVMKAADKLEGEGISPKVINVTQVKPFDGASVGKAAEDCPRLFTVEEHSVYGGLGSLVAETIAYRGLGAKVTPIGLRDVFASGYGTHAAVRRANGLDADGIYRAIREALGHE